MSGLSMSDMSSDGLLRRGGDAGGHQAHRDHLRDIPLGLRHRRLLGAWAVSFPGEKPGERPRIRGVPATSAPSRARGPPRLGFASPSPPALRACITVDIWRVWARKKTK